MYVSLLSDFKLAKSSSCRRHNWLILKAKEKRQAFANRINSRPPTPPHPSFVCCPFEGEGSVVVESLFIVASDVCGGFVFAKIQRTRRTAQQNNVRVRSSFAIILLKKRELVALLLLCSCCHVTVSVMWLFFAVPWDGLWSVFVAFASHNYLFFL